MGRALSSFSNLKFLFSFLLIFSGTIFLPACKSKKEVITSIDPAFAKYIETFTAGTISKTASIQIKLAENMPTTHALGEVRDNQLFQLTPSVKGKAIWLDARTIEFKPEKDLDAGQLYKVNFNLGKVTQVPNPYKEFIFNFQTITPAFQVSLFGLRSTGEKNKMYLTGVLETADLEKSGDIHKLISATLNKNNLQISWTESGISKNHSFRVDNITRTASEGQLDITWNGEPYKMKGSGQKKYKVPATNVFKVLEVLPMNEAEQYASVLFSDPVAVGQELDGLITISNMDDLGYSINGSEVKLYTGDKLDGNYTVNIHPGIENAFNQKLSTGYTANVFFENRLPSIKIQGRGNILPHEGQLLLPFETVNLSAVDISIIKIYENNVPQFLQENDLDGEQNLRRVGKPIVQKTLQLDNDKTLDLSRKQRFSLDLDKYLKTEPGAMYRVILGFRPEYSLYSCTDNESTATRKERESYTWSSGTMDEDEAFWSRYDNYYIYGYDWTNRNNPCADAYYNKDRWAMRNIVASNIGLTAKRGGDNQVTVAVSNILSTAPMQGVELEILDYQNQILQKSTSDKDGFAHFVLPRKPYLLIAKYKDERGYLKLDDGSSMPLSRFDITGEEIRNGIKGFIFGERGVWRPGDSLYINCIIESRENPLPDAHPVEFEFITPQGQLYHKIVQNNGEGGYNVFRTATSPEAPTGNWLVKIKAGGAVFEKRIKIETVMPNRLKIDLNMGRDTVVSRDKEMQAILRATWLTGATARNLRATVDASVYARKKSFPAFKDYTFYNPTTNYSTQTKTIFKGVLDDEGKAFFQPDFETDETAPGMLSANLVIKVFEPGGAFSINSLTLPYSPFKSYIGIKTPTGKSAEGFLTSGKTHTADLVNVDYKGRIISANSTVQVQFYKIQWRWWWDNSGDNLSNFTQDRYNKLLTTEKVTLVNGRGKYSFRIGEHEWGRYLILVKDLTSGHISGQILYMDQPGWQSRDNSDDPTAASMLSFTSDKEKYQVGEEITLTIPTSAGGRGLISLETGSKVLRTFWVDTRAGQTVIKFRAEKEMAPNIYANVSILQPHAQTINDLPIRMYGVIPVLIEDNNTRLQPKIYMASSIRPGQQTTISISEQKGRPMYYSIAVVDEGLLDLTRFQTPRPHDYFYSREALGVRSWDLYDFIIGAWGNNLERILTIGGDEDAGGPLQQNKANRFKPVVKYLGPFYLKKGQKMSHQLTLPEYAGSVRTMVVGAHEGRYGSAEKSVQVKKPLMLLGTAPRVLGPGESIRIPASVFAMENHVKNVRVDLRTNQLIKIKGNASKQLHFSQPGEDLVYFEVETGKETGIGRIALSATSGNEKADYEIELDIRNPNPPVTNILTKNLERNEQWTINTHAIGSINTAKATLELSATPAIDLEKRIGFLINYPHGCIEQITSGVFPQLYLHQLTDLTEARQAGIQKNIKGIIASFQNYQTRDGGFSYWPGGQTADEWGTNYAGHFLLEAQNKGFTVSNQMLQEWKNYQKAKARNWSPSTTNFYGTDLTQAYRLYLLAQAKVPETGAMNRLKEFKYLSPQAKWRLAAAYHLAGQSRVALQLISNLPLIFQENERSDQTYGSVLRDEAMILETLTLMNKRKTADALVNTIAAKLSQDTWYSTQTTAYALLALAKYSGQTTDPAKVEATVTMNGKEKNVNTNTFITQIPLNLSNGSTGIKVRNKGGSILYVRIINEGQPLTGESLQVKNDPSILSINVQYLTKDMKPLEVEKLQQGKDFIVKVTVRNPGRRGTYERLALTQIFPGGWEILNTRMQDGEGAFQSSAADYRDIRDDRVYTYFGLEPNKSKTFYVQITAAYPGRYFMPGTYCAEMYEHTITAGQNGKWVEVLPETR